jgi:hypothetical protein
MYRSWESFRLLGMSFDGEEVIFVDPRASTRFWTRANAWFV